MLTTAQLVQLVQDQTDTGSKYAAAKALGVSNQSVNDWTVRGRVMSDEAGLKTAVFLGLDADYVLACLQAERAKGSPAFKTWAHICKRLTPQSMRASA